MRITVERSNGKDGKGRHRVELVLVQKGRARYWTEQYVQSGDWDKKKRRLRVGARLYILINKRIDDELARAEQQAMLHPEFSPAELRDHLRRPAFEKLDFYAIARKRIEGSTNAHRSKQGKLAALKVFEKMRPALSLTDFTPRLLEDFEREMLAGEQSRNTVSFRLGRLKAMWNDACDACDVTLPNPWKKMELYYTEVEHKPLRGQELLTLIHMDLKKKTQRLYRDAWVLSFLCGGIRPTDVCLLKPENYRDGRLTFAMHKSRKKSIIRVPNVPPRAQRIIESYRGGKWLLPLLPEVLPKGVPIEDLIDAVGKKARYNLKQIAKLAGIEHLTPYVARHSMGAYLKANKVSATLAKDIFGHSSLSITQNYMNSFDDEAVKTIFEGLGMLGE